MTVRKTHGGLAPSVPAAASSRRSTASIERRMARTISGNPMTPQASAAPVQRKAKTMPKCSSRKRADRPAPAEGQEQQVAGDHRRQDQRQVHEAVRAAPCPGTRAAPAACATRMPNGRLTSVAQVATRMREADRGPFVGTEPQPLHRPAAPSVQCAGASTVKPCASKSSRRRLGPQEVEEGAGVGARRLRGHAPQDRRSAGACPPGRCRRPSPPARPRRRSA